MNKNVLPLIVVGGAVWWWLMRNPFAKIEASKTAALFNIPNKVPDRYAANARGLVKIYDRILSRPGAWVSSGYRSPELNAHESIGGMSGSHHQYARALDFGGWTEDEIVSDPILGLGITNKKQYDSGRWHMSWASEYLGML